MTIRVVCSTCHSKLDIREELAGSTRRCPKCKSQFRVPDPADESDGVEIAEDTATDEETSERTPAPPTQSPAAEKSKAPEKTEEPTRTDNESDSAQVSSVAESVPASTDDDDDDDYLPSFVIETAKEQSNTKSTPSKPQATFSANEEPVLSIPKIPPPPPKTSRPAFDPAAFLSEEPASSISRRTPAPPTSTPQRLFDGFVDGDSSVRPKRNRLPEGMNTPLPPTGGRASLSDSGIRSDNAVRDRAQAARELRQALKDSALREPQETRRSSGLMIDFSTLFGEVGIKGFALFFGTLLFSVGLYYASYYAFVGGKKLPPLGYVSGVVTLDGAPFAGAKVQFMPLVDQSQPRDKKTVRNPRTSTGVTDNQGHFKMYYEENIPGVTVGKCMVWVDLEPPLLAREYVRGMANYQEVTAGSNPDLKIDLTSARKRK